MFYASALHFNFAISPYFRQYSRTLANGNLAGYTPTYNRLRTTLLAQENEHINRLLQPIRESWRKKGAFIVSDGWSDRQRRPLINIMAASSGGAMFIKAIDASGNIKDADNVASIFDVAIKEIGKENVVQIITDNASNYKAAGTIIEARYPQIFWTSCVVHNLNLALKSICDPSERSQQYAHCKWKSELVNDTQNIRNFIVNHSMSLSIYNKHSKLSLLRVADTRFASSIIMAKRLRDVKLSLEKMFMDADWRTYKDGNNEAKSQEVKQCIVNDAWWDKLDYFLSFTEPIIDMLRAADTDTPILHLIYDTWDTMIENVKKIVFDHEGIDMIGCSSSFFDTIHQILEARWNKSNTPLRCMAHSLVPKYYCEAWLQEETLGGATRVSPNEDREVSLHRSKCFKRMFQDPNDLRKQEEYKNGPTKYWDLVGDDMALDGDSIELPELSLTEPELEMMTLNDEEEILDLE
ncbi:hypothetical protein C2S52_010715 [Perilla frutescens var. hirtella]|nr:hypothetical protein C2S52_010715 [Perilla frutescens var. hirtella]